MPQGNPNDYESSNRIEIWHLTDSFTEIRYKQMSKYAPTVPSLILDVGCGSGRGGVILRGIFPRATIIGLDAVRERVEGVDSPYDSRLYVSAISVPIESNAVDFILAGEIIEHIYPGEVDTFLTEMFRLLRIGGVFCFTTPNPNDIKLRLRGDSILGGSHVSQHFPRATKTRLNYHGFRVKATRGTGKVSAVLGTRFPLPIYGSYLVAAIKS